MSQSREFQIGDRVIYRGIFPRELGTITKISTEAPKDGANSVEVQRYEIALDSGSPVTGLSRHLRHAEDG